MFQKNLHSSTNVYFYSPEMTHHTYPTRTWVKRRFWTLWEIWLTSSNGSSQVSVWKCIWYQRSHDPGSGQETPCHRTTHRWSLLPADTKVYSALGNHDYHPKSQLPAGPSYIYNQTAEMWSDWLEPESRESFRKGKQRLWLKKNLHYVELNSFKPAIPDHFLYQGPISAATLDW